MKKISILLFFCLFSFNGCYDMAVFFDGLGNETINPVVDDDGAVFVFNQNSCEGAFFSMAEQFLRSVGTNKDYNPAKDAAMAVVVNNASCLEDMNIGGHLFRWPEIDFNKYSMIIGCCPIPEGGIEVVQQKGIRKKSVIEYYIDLERVVGGIASPTTCYFAALYSKLPDLEIEVHRYNNY